jgi:hypothetical protein
MAYRYDIGRWLTRGITKIRWYRVSNNYRLFPFDPKAGMTEPVNIHRLKYSTGEFYSQGIRRLLIAFTRLFCGCLP